MNHSSDSLTGHRHEPATFTQRLTEVEGVISLKDDFKGGNPVVPFCILYDSRWRWLVSKDVGKISLSRWALGASGCIWMRPQEWNRKWRYATLKRMGYIGKMRKRRKDSVIESSFLLIPPAVRDRANKKSYGKRESLYLVTPAYRKCQKRTLGNRGEREGKKGPLVFLLPSLLPLSEGLPNPSPISGIHLDFFASYLEGRPIRQWN